jgi:hypothetical protein
VTWVDHEELWRLQQKQTEGLRRDHARRHRLLVLAMAGLVTVCLAVAVFLLRSSILSSPPAPQMPATPIDLEGAATPPEALAVSEAPAEVLPHAADPERLPDEAEAESRPSSTDPIAAALAAWAGAWARQDVAAYLGSYAAGFRPTADLSRPAWESLRRQRLLTPATIRVEIEEVEIERVGESRAEARFVQSYSSPSYSDVVTKSLELVEEEGQWRIVSERAEPASRSN